MISILTKVCAEIEDLMNSVSEIEDKILIANQLRSTISLYDGMAHNPVDNIQWIKASEIRPNSYNPNNVAGPEMELLYTSISHDGYTQPIVVVRDGTKKDKKYTIVDGFHRYSVSKTYPDIVAVNRGYIPCVVLEKDKNNLMASTIRHNRARGKHAIVGMSNIVFEMLKGGWGDAQICEELGMEPEELLRLKYSTGYAKLYEGEQFSNAWTTVKQTKRKFAEGVEE